VAVVADLKGNIRRLDTDTGAAVWNTKSGAPVFATPCILPAGSASGVSGQTQVIVACVNGHVLSLDLGTGTKLWTFAVGSRKPVFSPPVYVPAHNTVVFGCHDGVLRALSPCRGTLLWEKKSPTLSPIAAAPVIDAHALLPAGNLPNTPAAPIRAAYCSRDGGVFMLLLHGGNLVQELQAWHMDGEVFSSPVLVGKRVLVGCRDDRLWCFRLQR